MGRNDEKPPRRVEMTATDKDGITERMVVEDGRATEWTEGKSPNIIQSTGDQFIIEE